jgi:hypothetical protein
VVLLLPLEQQQGPPRWWMPAAAAAAAAAKTKVVVLLLAETSQQSKVAVQPAVQHSVQSLQHRHPSQRHLPRWSPAEYDSHSQPFDACC